MTANFKLDQAAITKNLVHNIVVALTHDAYDLNTFLYKNNKRYLPQARSREGGSLLDQMRLLAGLIDQAVELARTLDSDQHRYSALVMARLAFDEVFDGVMCGYGEVHQEPIDRVLLAAARTLQHVFGTDVQIG